MMLELEFRALQMSTLTESKVHTALFSTKKTNKQKKERQKLGEENRLSLEKFFGLKSFSWDKLKGGKVTLKGHSETIGR